MHADLAVLDTPAALRAEAATLQRWIAESLVEGRRTSSTAATVLARVEGALAERETLVLVARAGAELLGVLIALPHVEPLTGEHAPEICVLHVHPNYRHRGLARALVADAVRRFTAAGAPRVLARANHNDDARISMGERWGFIRTSEIMERS
ncbi:MAG: N-acetyltransferase [Planctomycetota bacterium]|nr:MAG: N-acetyltransferase [Planctomycetota bacterium]